MVTMSDIARELGLSRSTVSFALSGKSDSNVQIPESTRQKIRDTAERLGFRRNVHAECLSRGRTPTIGVFLPRTNDRLIADLLIGLSQGIAAGNYPLEFYFNADFNGGEAEQYAAYHRFIEKATRERCSGLITYRYFTRHPRIVALVDEFQRRGGKILMINSFDRCPELPSVCIDDELGGSLAARHLLERGCGQLIHCYPTEEPRTRGFIQTVAQANRQNDLTVFDGADCEAAAIAFLGALPPGSRPGLFLPSDLLAIHFMATAARSGLLPGRDFLMVGYDGQLLTEALATPLTTIFQPFFELGLQAAELMLELLQGRQASSATIAPRLIERESSRFH